MNEVEKALSVYTQLVDQGVNPEYAQAQLKHRTDLGDADAEAVTADILGNTPQKYITRREEDPEAAAPAYDPVAAGKAIGRAQRERLENRDAFR